VRIIRNNIQSVGKLQRDLNVEIGHTFNNHCLLINLGKHISSNYCGDHQIPNSSCRFEVVAALSMKIRVLWDVTLFLTDTFSENCSILTPFYHADGGSRFSRKLLHVYQST
jgi:hypothetical protein